MNPNFLEFEQPIAELKAKIEELRHLDDPTLNIGDEIDQLDRPGGKTAVGVRYCGTDSSVCLRLGKDWQVSASRQLLSNLRMLAEVQQVEVVYHRGDRGTGPVNM